MMRAMQWLAKAGVTIFLAASVLLVHQSSGAGAAWPLIAHEIRVEMKRVRPRGLAVEPPLHFVAAWRLRSGDRAFGGLSALVRVDGGFLALSDAGALFELGFEGKGMRARIASLPAGCGIWAGRRSRDSESLAVGTDGTVFVGYERRNAICRIAPDGRATRTKPAAMADWPKNGGAETLVRLRNGALLAIAEWPPGDGPVSPALLFPQGGGEPRALRYRPPAGFRPTDTAQLPGGALLVLNRAFEFPLSLPGRLVLIDRFQDGTMEGREVARLDGPDVDQNFEGVAVSRARGRTFVWLISDDNFMPMQDTMLLLFEYRPGGRPGG